MNKISVWLMAAFFVAAGSNHFINPKFYLQIMPPYLPWHLGLIYLSGAFEIIFGIMLIPKASRKIVSLLLIALLIAVFPANVHMAIDYWQTGHPHYWLAVLRLPLQLAMIWWAWKNGNTVGNTNRGLHY